jgi:hypothetical protein
MEHHRSTTLGSFDGEVTCGYPDDCGYQSQYSAKSASSIKRQSHHSCNRSNHRGVSGVFTPFRVIKYQGSCIGHPLDDVIRLIATGVHGKLRCTSRQN